MKSHDIEFTQREKDSRGYTIHSAKLDVYLYPNIGLMYQFVTGGFKCIFVIFCERVGQLSWDIYNKQTALFQKFADNQYCNSWQDPNNGSMRFRGCPVDNMMSRFLTARGTL